MSELTSRIKELKRLWIDGTPASLSRIPALSDQIEKMATTAEPLEDADLQLLRTAGVLCRKAQQRQAALLELQASPGTYSTRGVPETGSGIVTAGWEG